MTKLAIILLAVFCLTNNLYGGGFVLNSTRLSTKTFGGSGIDSTGITIDANGNTFITVKTESGVFLYRNDNLLDTKQYGDIWGAFLKDNHFHLYLWKNGTMCIYKFTKDGDTTPVMNIGIEGLLPERFRADSIVGVIPVPEQDRMYYLAASSWVFPINPGEVLFDFASGGHGIYYWKPFLIEVQDGKFCKSQELRYGGNRDESFYIKQITQRGDLVHLLGLRQQEKRAWGAQKVVFTPVILHHTAYDLKKKKLIQANPIYTDTPRNGTEGDKWISYFYRDISMDVLEDGVFVTFSWEKMKIYTKKTQRNEPHAESDIFYWDCIQGKAGKAEKIADGFHPIVKADSLGSVHLLYVNDKANLMHKVKQKGIWQKETALVERVDMKPWSGNIAAAFDKDNSLHVVYPSAGSLVHAVIRIN